MKFALNALAATAVLIAGAARSSETINFDTLDGSGSTAIRDGYAGLNWRNFLVLGYAGYGGYDNALVSSPNIAYNGEGGEASLGAVGTQKFDLLNGFFTAGWNDGLVVHVTGYSGLTPIISDDFTIETSGPTFETFDFEDVTTVTFTSAGGIPNPLYVGEGYGFQFAMDNVIADVGTPEPSTWFLMLAGVGGVGVMLRKAKKEAVGFPL